MAQHLLRYINHHLVHDLVDNLEDQKIKNKGFLRGIENDKEKIGINLNVSCIQPCHQRAIPLFIANFVLDNYGEGCNFWLSST